MINNVFPSVQPLVFETGYTEVPYSTRGTAFIVGYAGRAFVLTTRHGLCPENSPPICLFPSNASQRIIPLKDVFFVSEGDVPYDFGDIAVIEIDMNKIVDPEVGSPRLIDLDLVSGNWLSKSDTVEMFLLGYPEEHQLVEYELEKIINQCWVLYGQYVGLSQVEYCHVLKISDSRNLSTFSGFSGAPVFAWSESPERRLKITLCGMALRGTANSGLIHFLDRSVLLDVLHLAEIHFKRNNP